MKPAHHRPRRAPWLRTIIVLVGKHKGVPTFHGEATEGNDVHPIFVMDEDNDVLVCGDCREPLL